MNRTFVEVDLRGDNDRMRGFACALLALATVLLAGCSSSSPFQIVAEDGRVLISFSKQPADAYQAIIAGELATVEGGCIGLTHGGTDLVAVFPVGTVLLPNGVAIPGLGELEFGEFISAVGGYVPYGSWADDFPTGCESEEVIVFS